MQIYGSIWRIHDMIRAILTMDDIPSNNTPAIVDYLNEKGIQAIMFAVGRKLEQHPEQAKYALQHGMIMGNHSYSHPAFSTLSMEESAKEIETCEELLDQLYQSAGVKRDYRPFRFPFGDKGGKNKAALQRYLAEKKFSKVKDAQISFAWWKENGLDRDIDTFWTFDFAEYRIRPNSGFTKEDVWKRIHDRNPVSGGALLSENSSHILLMHAHDETEEMVPGYCRLFIDHLLACGVTFDQPELIAFPSENKRRT